MRIARSPIVRLLVGGGALLVAARVLAWPDAGNEPRPAIELAPARIDGARRAFIGSTGRVPDERELAALVAAEVDDEILYREALARGLDRDDAVVQRRLLGNLAFVDGCADDATTDSDSDSAHDGELTRDMLARDVVVHRRLSARMRALLEAEALRDEPDDAELADALARHAERFALPPRVRVTHVALRDGEDASTAAALPRATELPLQSERDLARQLGAAFARAAFTAPVGEWSGPVASPSGQHLIRIEQREPARTPALATVRNQVRELLRRERADAAVREALAALRATYAVSMTPAPGDAG